MSPAGGAAQLLPPRDLPGWVNFDCVARDGTPLGVCGLLFREDGAVEIGYRIAPEHRRKGYASEALAALLLHAFEGYGLEALEAEVAEDNAPSLGLLAKLGFADTGRRREQWSARRQAYISYHMHRLSRVPTGLSP